MNFRNLRISILAVSTLVGIAAAGAATFTTESGFGGVGSLSSCKSGASTTAFATGQVLGGGNITGECGGYYTVGVDTTARTITLTAVEAGNYQTNILDITGITGVTITSLSTLSYIPLFDPNLFGSPANYGGLPAPVTSFTGSSISISFSTFGQAPNQFTFGGNGGTAVFAYNATAPVPEPASWTLLIGGFGLVGGTLRLRRAVPG